MISLLDLSQKLKGEKNAAIISHIRPDGDTIGSAFALALALEHLGISAVVVCDDALPSRFFFLNSVKGIKRELSGEYSAMIAIDCADVTRLGGFFEQFNKHKNTYNIDHHVSNTRYAKVNYVFDNASNCENVLSIIETLGVEITEDIANLLAMGVMTDTGCFKHKNVTANTLFSAGKLKEKGADLNAIYFNMFAAQSKERAKLFGRTMSKIRYELSGKLAIASIMQKDLLEVGAEQSETEGFIDFLMGIHGVEVGICILETANNKFKISFRSKSADVNAVAGSFGGGGHVLASGCQIQGEYEEVVDKLTFAVKRELPE